VGSAQKISPHALLTRVQRVIEEACDPGEEVVRSQVDFEESVRVAKETAAITTTRPSGSCREVAVSQV